MYSYNLLLLKATTDILCVLFIFLICYYVQNVDNKCLEVVIFLFLTVMIIIQNFSFIYLVYFISWLIYYYF